MDLNPIFFNSKKNVFTEPIRGSKERGPDRGTEYTVILRLNNDGKVDTFYFMKFEFRGNVLYNYNYVKGHKFFSALEKCYSILKGIDRKYLDKYKISRYLMETFYANQEEQTKIHEILGSTNTELRFIYGIKYTSPEDFDGKSFKLREKILDDEAAKFLRNSYLTKRGESDSGVSSASSGEGTSRRSGDKKVTRRNGDKKGKSRKSPPESIHKLMSKKISKKKSIQKRKSKRKSKRSNKKR